MSTKTLAAQRERFWQADPRCHYCGVETILKSHHIRREWRAMTEDERNRLATIDHIRPRHHPERLAGPIDGVRLHVLSCWRCNNDRDHRERAALDKQWFYDRGCSKPMTMLSMEQLIEKERIVANSYGNARSRHNRNRIWQSLVAIQKEIAWRQFYDEFQWEDDLAS